MVEIDDVLASKGANTFEIIDTHRFLGAPDGLADLLSELDCAETARVIDRFAGHLSTATHVDAVGIIDELSLVCAADRPGQSAMRNLSHAVAAFVVDCMQFVADDDTGYVIIEFVSTVPLVYGYDLLCKVGTAYGLVHGTPDSEFAGAVRYVDDINAIEHAIEIWRERARRVIASGYVMEEGDLFLFLDGLARLGVGATDVDAMAALNEFCRDVPGGFGYFLEQARNNRDLFLRMATTTGLGGVRDEKWLQFCAAAGLWPHKNEN